MKGKDLSLDLFAEVPHTEIYFGRDEPLKILTHGNGLHCITKGTRIFISQSDKHTDIYDPVKNEYVRKVISPYRIAYNPYDFLPIEVKLIDLAKESWREEALQIIRKAIADGEDVVEIPNFFEREWLKERGLKND